MSLSNPAYDPLNPEDKPTKSGLMTRKDAIRIGLGIALLVVLFIPLFNKLMEDRNKYVCRTHLGEVLKAMQLYAAINTDRFPPAMSMDDNYMPVMSRNRANTWVSVISGMMNKPTSEFSCPSAHEDEHVFNAGLNGSTLISDFGLYGAMSALPVANVVNPTQTVLISETSNAGSRGSYNPKAFGKGLPDGFLIGLDNCNFLPGDSRSLFASSKFATRLAFRDTKDAKFGEDKGGRHGSYIHVAFVDGHIGNLRAPSATVRHQGEEIFGLWSVR